MGKFFCCCQFPPKSNKENGHYCMIQYKVPYMSQQYLHLMIFQHWYFQHLPFDQEGLPRYCSGKNPPANAGDSKRCGFIPWVRKTCHRMKWPPILSGERKVQLFQQRLYLFCCINIENTTWCFCKFLLEASSLYI